MNEHIEAEQKRLKSRLYALHELVDDIEKHDFDTVSQVKGFIHGSIEGLNSLLEGYENAQYTR